MGILATAAMSAAPAIIGGISSLINKDNYKDDPMYQQYSSLYTTLNKQMAKPYLETTGAKSVLAAIREANDRRMKRITAAQAINGMTDEATVAAMGEANESEAEAISGLAGNADAHRNNLMRQKFGALQGMMGLQQMYNQRNAQNTQNIVQPLSQAISGYKKSHTFGNPFKDD